MAGRYPLLTVIMERGVACVTDRDCEEGRLSLTNSAEYVTATCQKLFPGAPVVYMDSEGRWDEMLHENGVFRDFRLLGAQSREEAVTTVLESREGAQP